MSDRRVAYPLREFVETAIQQGLGWTLFMVILSKGWSDHGSTLATLLILHMVCFMAVFMRNVKLFNRASRWPY